MKKIGLLLLFLLLAVVAYRYFAPTVLPPVHLPSGLPAAFNRQRLQKADSYLIRDVTVIPMTSATVLPHQHVLVEQGRVRQITPRLDQIHSSAHPLVIDGAGKYLIPELNDLHVHVNDDNNLLLFVANGVTTIRNRAGYPFHLRLREKINRGQLLGPTLYTASPILEGTPTVWKFSRIVRTRNEARLAVLQYAKAGYDFIKIYHTLPQTIYAVLQPSGCTLPA
ncbi:hypothetical protein ACFQ4C_07395 [Larkinella insperata]|uniref:Uncharacterized protein n=1 Tax=Larkinella insperata TaxID=332158 RepID=A0ABW3QB60_9BACT